MCLQDAIEAMLREAAAMELERVRPELPCSMCLPNNPCRWHQVDFKQGDGL